MSDRKTYYLPPISGWTMPTLGFHSTSAKQQSESAGKDLEHYSRILVENTDTAGWVLVATEEGLNFFDKAQLPFPSGQFQKLRTVKENQVLYALPFVNQLAGADYRNAGPYRFPDQVAASAMEWIFLHMRTHQENFTKFEKEIQDMIELSNLGLASSSEDPNNLVLNTLCRLMNFDPTYYMWSNSLEWLDHMILFADEHGWMQQG